MKNALILIAITLLSTTAANAQVSTVSLADLAGVWQTPCMPSTNENEISVLSFSAGGEVTDTAKVFMDSECTMPAYTIVSKSDLSINADALSGTATPYDSILQLDAASLIPNANAAPGLCGFTDWAVANPKTVIGTNCSPRDTVNLKLGKIDANTLRLTVCRKDGTCTTADYKRQN